MTQTKAHVLQLNQNFDPFKIDQTVAMLKISLTDTD